MFKTIGLQPCATAKSWLTSVPIIGLLAAVPACAQTPDLILIHGKILTVDAKDSIAEGVAIRQGKIVAVGSDKEILSLPGLRRG